jgi:hypothetical protein
VPLFRDRLPDVEAWRGRVVTIFNDLGERYFSTRLWE